MGASARCPQCRREFQERGPHFPFCSERCKLLDLGAWAAERYRIAVNPADQIEAEQKASPDRPDIEKDN